MEQHDEIIQLLKDIRENQRVSLQRQEEHLAVARQQIENSRQQIDESLGLQRQAIDRFKKISRIAVPAIIACIVLIAYLVIRYF